MVKHVLLVVNNKVRKDFILYSTEWVCRGHKPKLLIVYTVVETGSQRSSLFFSSPY